MYPSLFKAFSSAPYSPLIIYPMGKHAFILKGSTTCSAILATAVKVSCGCRVYLYLYSIPCCVVSLCGNAILLFRLYA